MSHDLSYTINHKRYRIIYLLRRKDSCTLNEGICHIYNRFRYLYNGTESCDTGPRWNVEPERDPLHLFDAIFSIDLRSQNRHPSFKWNDI